MKIKKLKNGFINIEGVPFDGDIVTLHKNNIVLRKSGSFTLMYQGYVHNLRKKEYEELFDILQED